MPLHPAIVHFPVALLSLAAFFAVISLFKKREFFKEIAFWNLLAGVIGAIAAVLTGLIEEQSLVHNDAIHQLLEKHELNGFAILVLSFSLLTWIWVRKTKVGRREYMVWVFCLVLGTGMVFYQGWLGGKMVFEQGAGVKPMESHMEQAGDSTNTHDHSGSGHDHGNMQDTTSKKAIPKDKPHAHPTGSHHTMSADTLRKKDSTPQKEKKKELKDMKY
jgi:uncharacterized membrane protein